MKNPSHPGTLLQESVMGIIDLKQHTLKTVAEAIDISVLQLSYIMDGNLPIEAELAVKLAKVFSNTTPEFWLQTQMNYDLSQVDKDEILKNVTKLW